MRQQIVQWFTYIFERHSALLVAFVALVGYLSGISDVSTIDGWGYAADVRNGEYLFRPHHLLFTITGYLWVKILGSVFTGIELITLLKLMNALAASAAIYMLMKLFLVLGVDSLKAFYLCMLAAFSWGFFRFAIDSEAYVIPTTLSVSASYFYIAALKSERYPYFLLSGGLAALACLYHQVMFFGGWPLPYP